MAAPTAPTGWAWIPNATTERRNTPINRGTWNGFVDASGNLVFVHNDEASPGVIDLYWSADDGATWTASGSNSVTPISEFIDVGGCMWADPASGYFVLAGEDNDGDQVAWVYLWNDSAKTFSNKAVRQVNSASDGQVQSMIAGWDTTNPDLLVMALTLDDDDTERVETVIYDKSDDSITNPGADSLIPLDLVNNNMEWGYLHVDGNNPHLLPDPKADTFYLFGVVSGDEAKVVAFSWNGTFFVSGATKTIDTIQASFEGCRGFFSPARDKWYAIALHTVGAMDINIWESSTNNPITSTWTHVAEWVADKVDTTLEILNESDNRLFTNPLLYTPTDTIYWLLRGFKTSTSDEDYILIEYDIAADLFAETEIGFADADFHSAPGPNAHWAMPYKGDGTGYIANSMGSEVWNGLEEYAFNYFIAQGVGSPPGGGFGPIPIGG